MKPTKNDNGLYRKFWTNSAGQPYSDGFHCGKDYGCDEGSEVFAVCDGKIALSGMGFMGYGSLNPSTPGGCVWIKHEKDGKVFFGTYGHLVINPSILNGEVINVKEGDVIGTVGHFTNARVNLPHVHFGVWNSDQPFPKNHWGYSPIDDKLSWVDPVQFLIDNNL